MKNLFFYNIIFSILLLGCNNSPNKSKVEYKSLNNESDKMINDVSVLDLNESHGEIINIPENLFAKPFEISKMIKEINFTLLETNDECLIGSVNSILSDSGFYFIHDKDNNNIFKFDYKGKFISKIGALGSGPHEFNEAWSVSIDRNHKLLSILDLKGRKILRYTYDGKFYDKTLMDYLYKELEYGKDNLVLYTGTSNNSATPLIDSYGLVVADLKQIPISKAFHYPTNPTHYMTDDPLRKFGDVIYFHQPFSNAIWQINEGNLIPKIKFKFKTDGLPENVWQYENNSNTLMSKLLNDHVFFSGNYIFAEDFYYFNISSTNKSSTLLQDRNSRKLYYWSLGVPFEYKGVFAFYRFLIADAKWYREDGFFMNIKNPDELVDMRDYFIEVGNKSENRMTEEEKSKLLKIKYTDNPIIVTYSFNKNL